jgi:hypothetical protein
MSTMHKELLRHLTVIPAQAGIFLPDTRHHQGDPRLRGDDALKK